AMINDVRALREPGALDAARDLDVAVCLMHMLGDPRTMQRNPQYDDVVEDVRAFLVSRAEACLARGIARERIFIDPGFGFGKTLAHNLFLLSRLERLADTGYPVLVGMSRKSMLGAMLERSVDERVHGSVALALIAYLRGARVIRAHDVEATADALEVARRVLEADAADAGSSAS
ncbi:MAG: dihydropteroate synthase, partial [Gammaproteobacteria bacterium]|nr:dihydropteroate synthase [Gammaproteobacteria bacterium]